MRELVRVRYVSCIISEWFLEGVCGSALSPLTSQTDSTGQLDTTIDFVRKIYLQDSYFGLSIMLL